MRVFRGGRHLLAVCLALMLPLTPAVAASGEENSAINWEPPAQDWSFSGPFGTFDRASLQRGFMVYQGVCQSCHTLRHVPYRTLTDLGFTKEEVDGITKGQANYYKGLGYDELAGMVAADHFPDIYNTEARQAAAAEAYGVVPPDLSLMAKARVGGPDYIVALLLGYFEDKETGETLNRYYPGGKIAMAQPLMGNDIGDGGFPDGTPATMEQEARDVAHFLMWAAEPKMEERKRMGMKVMIFLAVFSVLLYGVKRRVWSNLH